MNIVSSSTIYSFAIKALITVAILKLLSIIIIYFLPQHSQAKVPARSLDLPYFSLRLDKAFEIQAKESIRVDKEQLSPIEDLVLKALYGNTKNKQSSFIMVVEKNKKQTHLLSIGDELKKYKFIDINIQEKEAIFEAKGKRYTLRINKIKDSKSIGTSHVFKPNQAKSSQALNDVILAIPRGEILKYRENFKDIWKNISISEVIKKGKIDGFLIRSIKKGSIFSKLGLKKGDIIKSVNNNLLQSYADAFGVYYKMEKAKALKVTILRNNIKKELEYEIY